MKFKTQVAVAAAAAAVLLGATACEQDTSKADLGEPKVEGRIAPEDYVSKAPDKVTVYINVDDHPNIVRLCIDGLAFRTVSAKYVSLNTPAVERVPEWDGGCK